MKNDFEKSLNDEKNKVKISLKAKLGEEKLKLVKAELKSSGIEFDDNVQSVEELKADVKRSLSEIGYRNAIAKIEQVTQNLDKLVDNLESSTENSLHVFLNNALKIAGPISKAALAGLASRTAVVLAPTVGSKLAVTGVIMANSVYKLVKNKKAGNIVSRESECNTILQELEVTRNADGIVVDTRFSEEIQLEIRNFLSSRNINYLDTGYLSLRQALYELDFSDKKELCNIINNRLGRGINVEERISSKKYSFFKSFGKNTAAVGGGVAGGVGVATAVNSVDPAIIAAPLNGTALGVVAQEFTNSKALSSILGFTGGAGSAFLEYVPVIGGTIENALAMENLLACGVVGAGLGISSVLVSNVVKTIKNMHNQFANMKDQKEILSYDSEKYKKDNEEEILAMQALISKKNSSEEQVVFDLIYQYMSEELGMTFGQVPTTLAELRKCIEESDKKQKCKIYSFLEKLKEANNDHSDFVNTLIKTEKAVAVAATIGLAGLSVYDLLKDGTVIPEISRKIFKNVPNNIYLMIPEKPEISCIDYNGKISDRSQDLAMIEDVDKAKETYKQLEAMQKETNFIGEQASDIKQDIISNSNDVANGNFVENVKDFFSDPTSKLQDTWDSIVGFAKDTWDKVTNPKESFSQAIDFITETKYVPDTDKIFEKVETLSDSDLIDLAYYYNLSPDVDKSTEVYQAIGNILQQKLDVIQEGINDYNDMMAAIDTTSKAATAVAAGSGVIAELGNKGK